MNKPSHLILRLLIVMVGFFAGNQALAQGKNNAITLSTSEIEEYRTQARQLVKFMEYAFNSLAAGNVSAREKDVIINQSYLKFFKNSKVQIEDDLIEGRFVVTNKDVQAYLKDIDFFFTDARFEFNIEDISYNVNDDGKIFFIVTALRKLTGKSVDGEQVSNMMLRYIEINLDPDRRDLKIVSIYTNKISEKDEMKAWWASLDREWRMILAKGVAFGNDLMLKDIKAFDDEWALAERYYTSGSGGFIFESVSIDTIFTNASGIYNEIRRIWKTEEIDLSIYRYIDDLKPLSRMTDLKTVNAAGTSISDIYPVRNLTRLQSLDISNTAVTSIESLRYAIQLKNLFINKTRVADLNPLEGCLMLERLHANQSRVIDLSPLAGLTMLTDLRIGQTNVNTLAPIAALKQLQTLDISFTRINDLDYISGFGNLERLIADYSNMSSLAPVSGLSTLRYLHIEGTHVSDLQDVASVTALTRIYCDQSLIGREKALRFMQQRPDVLVIYDSKTLSDWWTTLPEVWKTIFAGMVSLSSIPTREELHQVANITKIDISYNKTVTSLSPLKQLANLTELNASGSGISDLEPLRSNLDLRRLDVSNTFTGDLRPLSALQNLEFLNLKKTNVSSLMPISACKKLQFLDIEHTSIRSLNPLLNISNLATLYCDSMGFTLSDVLPVYISSPEVSVIFRTSELTSWWNGLSPAWRSALLAIAGIHEITGREQLHRLTELRNIDLSGRNNLENLQPIRIFHRIETLSLKNTGIQDLGPVASLITLRELYAPNNPIHKTTALRSLNRLEVLDLSSTKISGLSDIGRLSGLVSLNISGTKVLHLIPLKNLHNLKYLDCSNTRIFFLNPLKKLPGLLHLKCYNTNVPRWNVESLKKAVPGCEVVFY